MKRPNKFQNEELDRLYGKCVGILVSLVFIGFGLALVVPASLNVHLAKVSGNWPHVTGRIVSIEPHRRRAPTVYYSYTYNGQEHENRRISYGMTSSCNRFFSDSKVGDAVRVYLEPKNPRESVLYPDLIDDLWVFQLMGSVFVVAGAIAGWATITAKAIVVVSQRSSRRHR